MKKKNILKKLLAIVVCGVMALSVVASAVMPVYAAEEGELIGSNGSAITETDPNWDDSAPPATNDDTYKPNKETAGATETIPDSGKNTGKGFVIVELTVPKTLDRDIVVELYNRDSGEVVKVPVYKVNGYYSRMEVPVGGYMVSNVIVGGDDTKNPFWTFGLGAKLDVADGLSASVNIKCLNSTTPTESENNSTSSDTEDGKTNVGISDEDLMTDAEIKEKENANKTFGQKALDFFLSLVTGSNLVILLVLVGSCIAVWIIKKKREDN